MWPFSRSAVPVSPGGGQGNILTSSFGHKRTEQVRLVSAAPRCPGPVQFGGAWKWLAEDLESLGDFLKSSLRSTCRGQWSPWNISRTLRLFASYCSPEASGRLRLKHFFGAAAQNLPEDPTRSLCRFPKTELFLQKLQNDIQGLQNHAWIFTTDSFTEYQTKKKPYCLTPVEESDVLIISPRYLLLPS